MSSFHVSDKHLRVLTAVSAPSALAALVYGYRWSTAPPVMTDDRYGRSLIPSGVIALAAAQRAGLRPHNPTNSAGS
ncbi:hypothetical protein BN970_05600 [Mycolicibacterium conceptionense]|uniref:Uncharacterized protein n=1 Tax=Mycolicibacterium conceptionense TaxID=451644 RepID=A0A0U1DWV8_9MYCO|nr:hypothetical protein BN970_05600 [Mycolicibacterium conceptionense]